MTTIEVPLGPPIAEHLDYLRLSGKSPRTLDDYRSVLTRLALEVERPLEEVTTDDLLRFAGLFPDASRAARMAAVNGFFRWALIFDRIVRDPADRLPPFGRPKPTVYDIFTLGEQAQLLRAAREGPLPLIDPVRLLLLLDAGARQGEARRLRVGDLDLDEQVVVLHGKGDKRRRVPLRGALPDAARVFLSSPLPRLGRLPDPSDHLFFPFCRRGDYGAAEAGVTAMWPECQWSKQAFHLWWVTLVERAGVRYRKQHMTRHTFATALLDAGVGLVDVKDLLGHESVATTQVYTRSSTRRLDHALELLATERGKQ